MTIVEECDIAAPFQVGQGLKRCGMRRTKKAQAKSGEIGEVLQIKKKGVFPSLDRIPSSIVFRAEDRFRIFCACGFCSSKSGKSGKFEE